MRKERGFLAHKLLWVRPGSNLALEILLFPAQRNPRWAVFCHRGRELQMGDSGTAGRENETN